MEAALRLYTCCIAIGTEHATRLKRRERATKAVFGNAIKDDVEAAWTDAREVFTFIVNGRGTEFADKRRMLAACGAPYLKPRELAKHEQSLAHRAGCAVHQHALTAPHPGRAMKQLICSRPAQNQRGGLSDVNSGGN